MARLAVILVNWRSQEQILCRTAAIRSWDRIKPRLLVVDNESTPESQRALSQALGPSELLCSDVNLGYGGGNNHAIARALEDGAEALLLLNPDADISEKTVIRLLKRLTDHPEIGILGPVLRERQHGGEHVYIGGKDISRGLATRIAVDAAQISKVNGFPLAEAAYVPGAVFLARSEVFERAGLFDERFFFSGETADLCARARLKGLKSFIDLETLCDHDTRAAPRTMRETLYTYYSLRNRMLYVRKHGARAGLAGLSYWAVTCLVQLGKALAKGDLSRSRATALALLHGISNKFGNQNAAFLP